MPPDRELTAHARRMRQNPTEAEARLWWALRGRQTGAKFRRQMPIGRYIADFACLSHRLIVEVDGHQHGETNPYDVRRNHWMTQHDFAVLRFSNGDILDNLEGVLAAIARELEACPTGTTPRKPPVKGGRKSGTMLNSPTPS